MANGGDVVELVHEQQYEGQQVNNVYYFEAAVSEASLSDLAAWFETNVVPDVKAVQNVDVSHLNLRLRNLFNLGETYEEPLTGTGSSLAGAVILPSFMAQQVRLDHPIGDIRSGFKRWSGLNENMLENALLAATQVTLLESLAGNLINPPTDSNPDWAHVVVKRICQTPNPDPEGTPSCLKYRLPENQGELEVGYPTSYEVYSQPTSQNSRKWYT